MKIFLIFNNFQKVKLNLFNYLEKEVEVINSSKRKGGVYNDIGFLYRGQQKVEIRMVLRVVIGGMF